MILTIHFKGNYEVETVNYNVNIIRIKDLPRSDYTWRNVCNINISTLSDVLQNRYHQAKMAVTDRASRVAAVVEGLERDMELLCLTGVEDKLQESVRPTLEMLRNAGIKVSHKIPCWQ